MFTGLVRKACDVNSKNGEGCSFCKLNLVSWIIPGRTGVQLQWSWTALLSPNQAPGCGQGTGRVMTFASLKIQISFFSPLHWNKDIYAAESVQVSSSKNQVRCCYRWQELSPSALMRNSSLKYSCWLRRAGFGRSAHVSHAFDSARNTVSQSFVVAQLKILFF